MKRCNVCKNCVALESVKERVLACVNPPFSHADQDVINLWNEELKGLPCERNEHEMS